ncbi:MAG: arginase family protein [Dehalococcoidia bacterium]|nr:arginase family protein [Dehalococcoidia bacterium]
MTSIRHPAHEPSTPAVPRGGDGAIRHGFTSFYGAPIVEDMASWRADVGFVGVPFDAGTNDRPGARFGPAAIRDASARYHPSEEWRGYIDAERGVRILDGVSMADVGDVDVRTVDLLENFDIITDAARLTRRGCRLPVFVGGDHAITFPIVRAFDDAPLTLIQFDAHQDYTDEKYGVRYSHDNHMRRSSELPHVRQIVQVGLRGVLERFEPYDAALRDGVIIVPSERIVRAGVPAAMAALPGGRGRSGGRAYVTIDIDVLDPAGAPGTGYPEPGGITYYQLKDALLLVAERYDVVGFDVTEVDPVYDAAAVTARLAAKLMLDLLGAIFAA